MRTVIHGAEFGPEHCYISCDDLPKDCFAAESSTDDLILKMHKSENVIKDIQFDENTEILRLEQAGPIKKSSKNFYTSNQKEIF